MSRSLNKRLRLHVDLKKRKSGSSWKKNSLKFELENVQLLKETSSCHGARWEKWTYQGTRIPSKVRLLPNTVTGIVNRQENRGLGGNSGIEAAIDRAVRRTVPFLSLWHITCACRLVKNQLFCKHHTSKNAWQPNHRMSTVIGLQYTAR